MPTTLDPSTALVLVDLQHGITVMPTIAPAPPIVERCARLAAAFRGGGKVVAATRVVFSADGGDVVRTRTAEPPPAITPAPDWGEFDAALALDERDLRITKRGWDPFYGTELDLQLRRRRVTGIVLGGIATSVGVESGRAVGRRARLRADGGERCGHRPRIGGARQQPARDLPGASPSWPPPKRC